MIKGINTKFHKTFFKLPKKKKVASAESIHLSHTINMMQIEGVLSPTSQRNFLAFSRYHTSRVLGVKNNVETFTFKREL